MNNVYVIADTHFGHKAAVNFRPFPSLDEHDRTIKERWNATVKAKDTVWLLGDAFFGRENHAIFNELSGRKNLILGNHDKYPMEIYQRYFHKILGAVQIHECLLTHIPIHPQQFYRYKKNIHGHLHDRKFELPYICVSAEQVNYTPILLRSLVD